jgi:hypothetical protein
MKTAQAVKAIAVLAAILLAGCGVEFFPEPQQATTSNPTDQALITGYDAGKLVKSTRLGPADFTVTTTHGVFSTYTSLSVPAATNVILAEYHDQQTRFLVGKILWTESKSILIRNILSFNK